MRIVYRIAFIISTILLMMCFMMEIVRAESSSDPPDLQLIFSDDFADGEFSNWQVRRNAQWQQPTLPCMNQDQPAAWEIVDGRLGITIDGSHGCSTEITPQSIELRYLDNLIFEFDWFFPELTAMDRNVLIYWQDEQNWYGLKTLGQFIQIQKVVFGQANHLSNPWIYYPFLADDTYHFHIEVDENLINVSIDDEQIMQIVDTYPFLTGSRTIGLQASIGTITHSSSFFDNIKVWTKKIGQAKNLNVLLMKQTNPLWSNTIYDEAPTWVQPDSTQFYIKDWGCALTSAVMILHFYGINQLPDQHWLNPSSLNHWLMDEPDGYVGDGLVNWLAISRLSAQMSETLQTPVLEFVRESGIRVRNIRNRIDQLQPSILHIPGHFFVADGYPAIPDELNIKDPAFNYLFFSQHFSEPLDETELALTKYSTSYYQPSQTDLSYIFMIAPAHVNLQLQVIHQSSPPVTSVIESLGEDEFQLVYLPKPPSGSYLISAEQTTAENSALSPDTIHLYTYSKAGELQLHQEIYVTNRYFGELKYQEQTSELQPLDLFAVLKVKLDYWYLTDGIKAQYAYLKLSTVVNDAQKYPQHKITETRYQQLFQHHLTLYQELISPEAMQDLSVNLDHS